MYIQIMYMKCIYILYTGYYFHIMEKKYIFRMSDVMSPICINAYTGGTLAVINVFPVQSFSSIFSCT